MTANVLGLCVQAGNRSTKADFITAVGILHFSPPYAKPLLWAVLFHY
jgi:hypothetical protein